MAAASLKETHTQGFSLLLSWVTAAGRCTITSNTQPQHWLSDKVKEKLVGVTIYLLHSSHWIMGWCTCCTVELYSSSWV